MSDILNEVIDSYKKVKSKYSSQYSEKYLESYFIRNIKKDAANGFPCSLFFSNNNTVMENNFHKLLNLDGTRLVDYDDLGTTLIDLEGLGFKVKIIPKSLMMLVYGWDDNYEVSKNKIQVD